MRTCEKTALIVVVAVLAGGYVVAAADPTNPYVVMSTIHSFASDGSEGGHPTGSLLEGADTKLYGTTWLDGPHMTSGCGDADSTCPGAIFSLTRAGGSFTVVHGFATLDSDLRNSDGYQPRAALTQDSAGYLYGTTSKGGNPPFVSGGLATPHGCGVAFKVLPDGTNWTVLHVFCSTADFADGASPLGSLIQHGDGYVYGATAGGGAQSGGVIYKLSTSGTNTSMYTFTKSSTDGFNPYGSPVFDGSSNLWGADYFGPTGATHYGHVYKLTTTSPYTFSDKEDFPLPDGTGCTSLDGTSDDSPTQTLLVASDGNLYGTSYEGGSYSRGGIFEITKDGSNYVWLYSFVSSGTAPPTHPYGGLIQASDGSFYGTTFHGGVSPGYGSVFSMTPPLSFPSVSNAALSTVYTSSTITVPIVNNSSSSSITISNGEYSINGGAFTSSAGTVHTTSDRLAIRTTSSSSHNTRVLATYVIGNITGSFAVTTAP